MHLHMLTGELLDLYMNRALDSLEGPLPRLVFLTSLRDPYTGRYLHEGWATVFPPDAVHATLRDTHRNVFESVVNLMLPALCNELRRHSIRSARKSKKSRSCGWKPSPTTK